MFTGLIEELGVVRSIERGGDGARITIDAREVLTDATVGASLAVNGCCLTVTAFDEHSWCADVVPESLARTTLGALSAGDRVNLERPVAAGGRYGGHVVQGHVDTTVRLVDRVGCDDGSWRDTYESTAPVRRFVVEKGSIALDGVSLTVAAVGDDTFTIAVIPHTYESTTLSHRSIGDSVNVEVDVLAKYVERLARPYMPADPSGTT